MQNTGDIVHGGLYEGRTHLFIENDARNKHEGGMQLHNNRT